MTSEKKGKNYLKPQASRAKPSNTKKAHCQWRLRFQRPASELSRQGPLFSRNRSVTWGNAGAVKTLIPKGLFFGIVQSYDSRVPKWDRDAGRVQNIFEQQTVAVFND